MSGNYGGTPNVAVLPDRTERDKPAPKKKDPPPADKNPNEEPERYGRLGEWHERADTRKTRQTSVTLEKDVDQHLRRYFLRAEGRRFKTKSEVINYALREFLATVDGPGGTDADG